MKPTKATVALSFGAALTVGSAMAADTVKSYTTTLYELDNSDARSKRIRLIYSVENAWNQSHWPEGIKEVKLLLNGGSGFDMTNVPRRDVLYEYTFGGDYRYTIPTAFQMKVGYSSGSPLRHINHVPANTIEHATVNEKTEFNLGFSLSETPSLTGGASWGSWVSYKQEEFRTIADFNQANEGITWTIENKSIRHNTPVKDWLLYKWTYLGWGCGLNNLISPSELPVVMRSDFRPEAAAVYRKQYLRDGQTRTRLNLEANWRKTRYHFARDWCTFYTNFSWKGHYDYDEWISARRTVSISWQDWLYH